MTTHLKKFCNLLHIPAFIHLAVKEGREEVLGSIDIFLLGVENMNINTNLTKHFVMSTFFLALMGILK